MAYDFNKISVLVVESTPEMYQLIRSVLQAYGVVEIHSAYGGEQGFEKFQDLNPDIMIIDWLQNYYSGVDLTRKIRTDEKSVNPFVPIILTTGFSQKRRVLAARDSGITEFLVKPFTSKALYQKMEQMIEFPRVFVRTDSYVGPDRRRKRKTPYDGPERRQNKD